MIRAQLGDRRALTRLVEHWHERLWRYVHRMVGPAADDVTQQAWVAALAGLPRLRQPERFAAWLFVIARRAVMDHLRLRYAAPEPLDTEPPDERDDLDAMLDRTRIDAGLALLPPLEREVLELFHLQDLTLLDCAEILGVPPGTVKSRLFRARRMLRDRLTEKGSPS